VYIFSKFGNKEIYKIPSLAKKLHLTNNVTKAIVTSNQTIKVMDLDLKKDEENDGLNYEI